MPPTGFEAVKGKHFTYPDHAGRRVGRRHPLRGAGGRPEPALCVYSWKGGHEGNVGYGSRLDTVVTFTLAKVDGGTRLRLVHSGFVLPRNDSAYKNMSGGWKKVVPRDRRDRRRTELTRQISKGRGTHRCRTACIVRRHDATRRLNSEEVSHAAEYRIAAAVGSRAPAAAGEGEGADPRPRRAGRRAPADAVDGGGEGLCVRRTERQSEPAWICSRAAVS